MSAWSPTIANAVAIAIVAGLVAGAAVAARWLKKRLREPQPVRRIAEDLACVGILVLLYPVISTGGWLDKDCWP